MKPNFIDRILYKSRIVLLNYKKTIISSSITFLSGMIINTLSTPELSKDFLSILNNIFSIQNRPLNILSYIAVIGIFFIPLITYLLKIHEEKRGINSFFITILDKSINSDIRKFSFGRIAWSSSLTIQQTPELNKGWSIEDVIFNAETNYFTIPPEYMKDYEIYFEKYKIEKSFHHDGEKYMLKINPKSSTDSPSLNLNLIKTKYSIVQFYRHNIATNIALRDNLISKTLGENVIDFPNSLCLHLVIVTSDNKILFTKRSEKVDYYASMNSVSCEEQFHIKDFENPNLSPLQSCLERLFDEELGKQNNIYNLDNFRILSVFVETDILNISLAGILKLEISAVQLTQSINNIPRKDDEFTDFSFKTFDDLVYILKYKNDNLHPSAGYRILLTLYNKFGPSGLIKKLTEE